MFRGKTLPTVEQGLELLLRNPGGAMMGAKAMKMGAKSLPFSKIIVVRDRGKGSNGVVKRGGNRDEFPSTSALKGTADRTSLTRGRKKAMSEETKVGFTVIIGTRDGGVIVGVKDMRRIVEGNLLKMDKKLIKDAWLRGKKVKLRAERGNEVEKLVVNNNGRALRM